MVDRIAAVAQGLSDGIVRSGSPEAPCRLPKTSIKYGSTVTGVPSWSLSKLESATISPTRRPSIAVVLPSVLRSVTFLTDNRILIDNEDKWQPEKWQTFSLTWKRSLR